MIVMVRPGCIEASHDGGPINLGVRDKLREQAGAESSCNFRAAAKTAAALFLSGSREPDAPERGETTLTGTLRDGFKPHEG
jgi:hypothetical protein